jgi:hypothetical protein
MKELPRGARSRAREKKGDLVEDDLRAESAPLCTLFVLINEIAIYIKLDESTFSRYPCY